MLVISAKTMEFQPLISTIFFFHGKPMSSNNLNLYLHTPNIQTSFSTLCFLILLICPLFTCLERVYTTMWDQREAPSILEKLLQDLGKVYLFEPNQCMNPFTKAWRCYRTDGLSAAKKPSHYSISFYAETIE